MSRHHSHSRSRSIERHRSLYKERTTHYSRYDYRDYGVKHHISPYRGRGSPSGRYMDCGRDYHRYRDSSRRSESLRRADTRDNRNGRRYSPYSGHDSRPSRSPSYRGREISEWESGTSRRSRSDDSRRRYEAHSPRRLPDVSSSPESDRRTDRNHKNTYESHIKTEEDKESSLDVSPKNTNECNADGEASNENTEEIETHWEGFPVPKPYRELEKFYETHPKDPQAGSSRTSFYLPADGPELCRFKCLETFQKINENCCAARERWREHLQEMLLCDVKLHSQRVTIGEINIELNALIHSLKNATVTF